MTSTSFINGTGLKKWNPAKRCGVFSLAAIVVTDIDEVLVARMHSGVTMPSRSPNSARLASRFSTIASTTMWQALNSASDWATLIRAVAASASAVVMLPFSAARLSILATKSRASSAAPARVSIISTCMPPAAATCTMPRPMAPVPITPIQRSARLASKPIMIIPEISIKTNSYNYLPLNTGLRFSAKAACPSL